MSSSAPSVLLDMRPLQGPSAKRGVGSYAIGLITGLVAEGFDPHLTLLLDARHPTPSLPAGKFSVARTVRRYSGNFAGYEEAVAMRGDLERLKPDVYHAIDLRLPGSAPCPLVVTLHDLIPWAFGGSRMWGERMRYWLGRRLLRNADLVLAVSQSTANDAVRLARISAERIKVVPEAAPAAFTPSEGAAARVKERFNIDAGYLLFVGALDARKDPAALLRAWSVARESRPDLNLVLVGEPGKQAPQQMPQARVLGHLGESELIDVYSAAGCLVFPSRYEGFGLPCLEALACGCPVAAYRNSSLPEVVDGAGELVQDGDADALGRAAARLASDSKRPWQPGLERARKFSWRKTAKATISAYESLLR
jgi:glycosyltransferase involved in cell wall biosynthesis